MTSSILYLWWSFAATKTGAAISSAALLTASAVVQRPPCCTAKWYLLHCKVARYTTRMKLASKAKEHDARLDAQMLKGGLLSCPSGHGLRRQVKQLADGGIQGGDRPGSRQAEQVLALGGGLCIEHQQGQLASPTDLSELLRDLECGVLQQQRIEYHQVGGEPCDTLFCLLHALAAEDLAAPLQLQSHREQFALSWVRGDRHDGEGRCPLFLVSSGGVMLVGHRFSSFLRVFASLLKVQAEGEPALRFPLILKEWRRARQAFFFTVCSHFLRSRSPSIGLVLSSVVWYTPERAFFSSLHDPLGVVRYRRGTAPAAGIWWSSGMALVESDNPWVGVVETTRARASRLVLLPMARPFRRGGTYDGTARR